MKKIIIITFLSFFFVQGQENPPHAQSTIKIGDILIIGTPSSQKFRHIYFPRTNFIIKKGGIPNYKKLIGNRVVVTAVHTDTNGLVKISLKQTNGTRFFGSITTVNANLEKALKENELRLVE